MIIKELRTNLHLIPPLARCLHAEWAAFPHWSSAARIETRLRQRALAINPAFTLLALSPEAEILATASIIHYELADQSEREYWLGEVLTLPAQRGKGLATALVMACVQRCREQDLRALYLYTPDQQALYQRLGWQEIEQRTVAEETVSVMQLLLR